MATVTAREIAAWCKRRGTYPCGANLYLQVSSPGRASWLFRFMQHKRPHGMGLGSIKNWTLAQARERAKEQRQLLDDGIDPLQHRRAARAAKPATVTFDECAKLYWSAHRAEWTSKHHAAGWLASITRIASPHIGNMSVAKIALADVLAVLESEWVAHYPTMSRLRGRIELVLGFAAAHGWRDANNPATWDILKHVLPTIKHEKKRRAAMAYSDVPKFYGELCAQPDAVAAALRLLVLTACRPGEVRGARWSEIDGSLWTIPASRMKARKQHVVTLSPAAIALLEVQPRTGDVVFPILKEGSFRVVLAAFGHGDIDPHGFRSSFRDWSAECTDYPREIAELALAHTVGSEVERAYRRTTLIEKRRELMTQWAQFCEPAAMTDDVVIRLDQARAG